MSELYLIDTPADTSRADSPDARRTARQRAALDTGWHPLSLACGRLPLHVDAAPVSDAHADGRRCGNCRYLRATFGGARTFAKCWYGAEHGHGPRITRGPATDVRAWWPACQDHDWQAEP